MKHTPLFYFSFLLPISAIGTPTNLDPQLNQIDATEQQRQVQQQAQREQQFKPDADVRIEIEQEHITLPNNESPCYPIHQVSLVDYSPDNSLTTS